MSKLDGVSQAKIVEVNVSVDARKNSMKIKFLKIGMRILGKIQNLKVKFQLKIREI